MAYEVLFTIWQGGQLAIPVRTTLGKVKTILGADYTPAILCSIMYAQCCQTLACSNYAKSVACSFYFFTLSLAARIQITYITMLNQKSPSDNGKFLAPLLSAERIHAPSKSDISVTTEME